MTSLDQLKKDLPYIQNSIRKSWTFTKETLPELIQVIETQNEIIKILKETVEICADSITAGGTKHPSHKVAKRALEQVKVLENR